MDPRAQQAREEHRLAGEAEALAARHRDRRDRLVRLLRADDPGTWTYPALAAAVRCSEQLIVYILKRKSSHANSGCWRGTAVAVGAEPRYWRMTMSIIWYTADKGREGRGGASAGAAALTGWRSEEMSE